MRKIVKDSFYTTTSYFTQRALAFLREIILANILGPYYYGLRNAIITLYNFAPYALLGITSEMDRKVALLYEKNKREADEYFSTTFIATTLVSIILALLVIGYGLLSHHSDILKMGIYLLSVLVVLRLTGPTITSYLTAKGQFKYTSAIEVAVVSLNFVLVVGLAYLYGFIGALMGLALPLAFRLYMHLRRIKGIPFTFSIQKLKHLLRGGLRLYALSISGTVYAQVDRLITVVMLGPAALGVYGIAQSINSLIHGTFGATVQPLGQRMLKNANNEKQLRRYLNVSLFLSSFLMVFPVMVIILASVYLIPILLPEYTESIPIIRILAVAVMFNIMLAPVSGYMIAKRRETLITLVVTVAALLNIGLNYGLVSLGWGINGIAVATSTAYFSYFILLNLAGKVISLRRLMVNLIPVLYLVIFDVSMLTGILLLPAYIGLGLYLAHRWGIIDEVRKVIR